MCCIQPMMHSCALFCIPEHYGGTIPETECVGMHRTVEPHILTQEKPSGLKAKLTCGRNGYGGWTGCGRAIRRAHGAPMCHYMSSKSSSDSSPSPSSSTHCDISRLDSSVFQHPVPAICCEDGVRGERRFKRRLASRYECVRMRTEHEADSGNAS